MTDQEIFDLLRKELFTAVVGDVLDDMGLHNQFLPQGLAPLTPGSILVGRAMPVLETDYVMDEGRGMGPLARQKFGLMFDALDDLQPGEIYVATGASPTYALWGELMSTRATHLKAAGALLDGFVRDAKGIAALDFPCFSYGLYAQDQGVRGKVVDYRTSVKFGGITITPGTLLFGDEEGVLVIPNEAEDEALRRACEKASTENAVAAAIRKGMSASEAFKTFGVM